MSRKPPVPEPPEPPEGLSEASLALWQAIVPRRARSPERLALIETALRARDRAAAARETLVRDGMTFTTAETGAIHVHPAVRILKDAETTFLAAWRAMHLEWGPLDSG